MSGRIVGFSTLSIVFSEVNCFTEKKAIARNFFRLSSSAYIGGVALHNQLKQQRAQMPEWSKGVDSSSTDGCRVGSNPTLCTKCRCPSGLRGSP